MSVAAPSGLRTDALSLRPGSASAAPCLLVKRP